jgi:hypothetical protein
LKRYPSRFEFNLALPSRRSGSLARRVYVDGLGVSPIAEVVMAPTAGSTTSVRPARNCSTGTCAAAQFSGESSTDGDFLVERAAPSQASGQVRA